jgi:SAM-dependent methyltransferase
MDTTPYELIAPLYDRWMAGTPYHLLADFLQRRMPETGNVLDLCCGTGKLLEVLGERGHMVTGIDGSAAMLKMAAERTSPGTRLIHADLPAVGLVPAGSFDAVTCTCDSVNYFVGDGRFAEFARMAADALRPGGVLVFDVITRYAMENVLAPADRGGDHGDFAYMWQSRYDPETERCHYSMSFFVQEGELYRRVVESHVQRWFSHQELRDGLRAAGFGEISVTDDYRDAPCEEKTTRETWTALTRK